MKINISTYNPILSDEYPESYYRLKEFNTTVLPVTANIGGIVFDINEESLKKIDILSKHNSSIDFIDAYNNTVNIEASTLKNYLSAINEYHADNLIRVNKLYNTLKNSSASVLSDESILSAYNDLGLNKITI